MAAFPTNRRGLAPRRVIILTLLLVVALCLVVSLSREYQRIDSHEIGDDIVIRIYEATSAEISRPVYYEIVQEAQIVAPKHVFYYAAVGEDSPELNVVGSREGDIIGLVPVAEPDAVMILYEPSSHRSYPGVEGETPGERQAETERLMRKLRSVCPEQSFELHSP